jgi:hypothetical protein
MYNQYIEWNSSPARWEYSPVKYWPNGIDAANAANSPSNTAVQETGEQKLSFFAYAPYTKNLELIETPYTVGTDYSKGFPESLTAADIFKTEAWKSTTSMKTALEDSKSGGIVGVTGWEETKGPWLNYVMHNDNASTEDGLDLLWGLRGKFSYSESDKTDYTIDATGELGKSYNTDLTKQIVGEKVKFLFKHALAKLGGSTKTTAGTEDSPYQSGLKIVVDVDDNNSPTATTGQTNYFSSDFNNLKTLVTVKSIYIRDKGTYANEAGNNLDPSKQEGKSDLKTCGWFNIATGQWDTANSSIWNVTSDIATGAKAELTVDNSGATGVPQLNRKIKEIGVGSGKKELNSSDKSSWTDDASSTTKPTGVLATKALPVYDNSDNPGIMLIPGDDVQTLYVTIDYFVRTADKQLKAGWSEVEQIITNKVEIKGLEANKYYTLIIHLGLTSVKFEAVVADWTTTTDATFDEDGHTTEGTDEVSKSVWLPSNVVNTTTITASAGTDSKEVTVAGHIKSYTINLENLPVGYDLTPTHSGTNVSGVSVSPTTVPADGKATATVTLTANDGGTAINDNEITITASKSGETDVVTKVTIIQQPAVLSLTAPATIESDATTFTANLINEGGDAVTATGTPTVSGVTGATATPTSTTIVVTVIPVNTTVHPIEITLTADQVNNPSVTVVQKAGELVVTATSASVTPHTWTDAAGATPANLQLSSNAAISGLKPAYTVSVNSGAQTGYTFSSNVAWLAVNATTGEISVSENTSTTEDRTAIVTITKDGATVTFTVTQPKKTA